MDLLRVESHGPMTRLPLSTVLSAPLSVLLLLSSQPGLAQTSSSSDVEELKQLVLNLEQRVSVLEDQNRQLRRDANSFPANGAFSASALSEQGSTSAAALVLAAHQLRVPGTSPALTAQALTPAAATAPTLPGTLPGGATLNYYFDGYYEYNFNNPTGRVNDLRAYDVLSNVFSINQADFIFDLDPDLAANRRYGFRVDLQFGQATETLQGNPANETRPEIYRNIFQAYGSYIVPIGHGLNIDVGKWASSLGYEGNYTKDQNNYTRSFYFYYLPLLSLWHARQL